MTHKIVRYANPENSGISAIDCAIPTVNGLSIAVANPTIHPK